MSASTHDASLAPSTLKTSPSVWVGRVLSGIVVLFLIMDGVMKLAPLDVVLSTMRDIGYPDDPASPAGSAS